MDGVKSSATRFYMQLYFGPKVNNVTMQEDS